MSAVVEVDALLVDQLSAATGDLVTVLPSLERLDEHLDGMPLECAVILGPSVSDTDAAALAERYRVARPRVAVVLVRENLHRDVLAAALRSGMREVVTPADGPGIREAVARAHAAAQALSETPAVPDEPNQTGRVLTVFATKGGVGKSLVAVNVAGALADLGRRVCLLDLDLADGDVAVMLRVSPPHSLADLESLGDEIDASGVGGLLLQHGSELSILAAPARPGVPLPGDRIAAVIEVLRDMFDHVVIDTSGMFDDVGLAALDHSDLLVLVGTLDVPSLKSLKLAVATLDLLNMPRDRWRFILNRADAKVGLTVDEYQETLGLRPDAQLGSSKDVLAAVNRGEQIVLSQRGHQVSKALRAFAATIDREAYPVATSTTESSRRTSGRTRRIGARRTQTNEGR